MYNQIVCKKEFLLKDGTKIFPGDILTVKRDEGRLIYLADIPYPITCEEFCLFFERMD